MNNKSTPPTLRAVSSRPVSTRPDRIYIISDRQPRHRGMIFIKASRLFLLSCRIKLLVIQLLSFAAEFHRVIKVLACAKKIYIA